MPGQCRIRRMPPATPVHSPTRDVLYGAGNARGTPWTGLHAGQSAAAGAAGSRLDGRAAAGDGERTRGGADGGGAHQPLQTFARTLRTLWLLVAADKGFERVTALRTVEFKQRHDTQGR